MHFWFWNSDLHIGMVLIITFIVGAMIGIISSFPLTVKKNKKIKELTERISRLSIPLEIIDPGIESQDSGFSTRNPGSDSRDFGKDTPDPEFEDVNQ